MKRIIIISALVLGSLTVLAESTQKPTIETSKSISLTSEDATSISQNSIADTKNKLGAENVISQKVVLPKRKFTIESFIEIPSLEFLVSVGAGRESLLEKEKRIQFVPSATSMAGLRLSYADFYWSLKSNIFKNSESYVEKYGSANFVDTDFNYSHDNWLVKINYQNYKGFYTDLNSNSGMTIKTSSNSSTTPPNTVQLPQKIVKRPDIVSQNISAGLYLDAPVIEKSMFKDMYPASFGVNVLLGSSLRSSEFKGDQSFVPEEYAKNFGKEASLHSFSSLALDLSAGVDFSWYYSQYVTISLGYIGGIGIESLNLGYDGYSDNNISFPGNHNFFGGYYYRGQKHLFSATMDVGIWSTEGETVNLDLASTRFLITYGQNL